MESITFQSRWVENCIRRVLGRPEGELCMEDISAIQYAKAGGDFMGGAGSGNGIMLAVKRQRRHDGKCAGLRQRKRGGRL